PGLAKLTFTPQRASVRSRAWAPFMPRLHVIFPGRLHRAPDPAPMLLPGAGDFDLLRECPLCTVLAGECRAGGWRAGLEAPAGGARLRELRRGRIGTRVLRAWTHPGPGVRADGRRLGRRHHPLRYGRRLWRRSQRARNRALDLLARGDACAHDEDVQPDASWG